MYTNIINYKTICHVLYDNMGIDFFKKVLALIKKHKRVLKNNLLVNSIDKNNSNLVDIEIVCG